MAFYGHWPSDETRTAYAHQQILHPVLRWVSIVSAVKTARAAAGVGYDFTDTIHAGGRLAVIPIGYWHGYPRALSGLSDVLIRGKRARIKGRVSMDMLVVDVSDIPDAVLGDPVVLIGQQGEEHVTVQELSRKAGMSDYEFITRLNPLMRRFYT